MTRKFLSVFIGITIIANLATLSGCKNDIDPESDNVVNIAEEAYIFGLPLILMDITRRQATNTTVTTGVRPKAPMNHFNFAPAFPDANFRDIVRPNNDTFYSSAWLDLRDGPITLTLPNTNNRYHVMQMMDAYTNVFAAPGTRTTGNGGGKYLISGPGWTGSVPAGMTEYKSATNYVWILGRTQVNSQADGIAVVTPIMQQYALAPLNGSFPPPADVDPTVPSGDPNSIVNSMPIDVFFNYLNSLMIINPPVKDDEVIVKRISKIGVAPGGQFDLSVFTAKEQEDLMKVPGKMLAYLTTQNSLLTVIDGWSSMEGAGNYGTKYMFRAFVSRFGLGANLPEDAVYYNSNTDKDGTPYNGSNKYVLRFETGKTPPVKAFWSITLYDTDGYLVHNAINRYAIGDRSGLVTEDGFINIYIQNANPGAGKESNWLPAPNGNFNLILRAYYPEKEIFDGSWTVPGVSIVQ